MKNNQFYFIRSCHNYLSPWRYSFFIITFLFFYSCKEKKHITEKHVVVQKTEIDPAASDIIQSTLEDEVDSNGQLKNFRLGNTPVVQYFYKQRDYKPLWSDKDKFLPMADSLFAVVANARAYGLFPEDYGATGLKALHELLTADTAAKENKLDASKWAQSDLLLTDAFVSMIKDIRWGRLQADSVIKKDSTYSNQFFYNQFQLLSQQKNLYQVFAQLEPQNQFYAQLKEALQGFLEKAKFRHYTNINLKDSALYKKLIARRLVEEDSVLFKNTTPDSVALAKAIKKYQQQKGIKADGKISAALISRLNQNDENKFKRIALNLDRFKQLPVLPAQYILVNIPGYKLQLWDSGIEVLTSKIIVGKPETRTPQLTSAISDMITYPKWHIPESIIKKDILPGLKNDPGYLARKGFSLVDSSGNDVNPYAVKWAQYKNSIPYTVVQGSGDDNALGVLKFNFPNNYSVYLHDTNQRYLFAKEKRALSHGCVRVQAWDELADYILENDNKVSANAVPVDSLQTWLMLKEKHVIPVRKKIPLFIRYFTSMVDDEGHIVFYEDIYGDDRRLQDKFFGNK